MIYIITSKLLNIFDDHQNFDLFSASNSRNQLNKHTIIKINIQKHLIIVCRTYAVVISICRLFQHFFNVIINLIYIQVDIYKKFLPLCKSLSSFQIRFLHLSILCSSILRKFLDENIKFALCDFSPHIGYFSTS